LTFDSPEVDRWKGMVACCKLALVNLFDLDELVACFKMICYLITITVHGINTYNFLRDLQWNNIEIMLAMLKVMALSQNGPS